MIIIFLIIIIIVIANFFDACAEIHSVGCLVGTLLLLYRTYIFENINNIFIILLFIFYLLF